MPNWVHHRLTITGPEAELIRFLEACFTATDEGPRLDFDKLIPMPEHIKNSTDGGSVPFDKPFRFPDWYEWSLINWGTKWGAHYTKVQRLEGSIKLDFDTAWNIPWPILEEIADRFPLLTFNGDVIDMQWPFGGDIRIDAGEIRYVDRTDEIRAEMDAFYAELDAKDAARKASGASDPAPGQRIDDDVPF